jgi:spermidine/putrescine transport system permease protein
MISRTSTSAFQGVGDLQAAAGMGATELAPPPPGLSGASLALLYFLVISFWSVRARIMRPDFTLKNYVATWADYYDAMGSTLLIAFAIGALTTLLALGFAYAIRFKCGRFETPLLFLALITLFGGYLVKIYAWKSILGREGILNQFLRWTGLIDQPLDALALQRQCRRDHAHSISCCPSPSCRSTATSAPFGRPPSRRRRAILGAGRWAGCATSSFRNAKRASWIAFTFAFLITAGDYVTPRFVGGGAAMMGHFIELQFSLGFNWPMGSAMAFTVMAVSLALVMLFRGCCGEACSHEASDRATWRSRLARLCLLTAAFMGAPLVLVVLFSFNQSARPACR